MEDTTVPLQFINLSDPGDQSTSKARAARAAVTSHIAKIRGRNRRILDAGTRPGYEPGQILQSFHVWRNGQAPDRNHRSVEEARSGVTPLLYPRHSVGPDDALKATFEASWRAPSFAQILNAPRKEAEARAEESKTANLDRQQLLKPYQPSHPTGIQPASDKSSPPLLNVLSHGNSDPFCALALSCATGPAINQIVTWHRQVQIPAAYPYAPDAHFSTSKSMQRSWQDAVTCLHTPVLADAFLACRAATMAWMVGPNNQGTCLGTSALNRIALEVKMSAYRAISMIAAKYQRDHTSILLAISRAPIFLYWAEIVTGDTTAASKHLKMMTYLEEQGTLPGFETPCAPISGRKTVSLESLEGTWYTGGDSNVMRLWDTGWGGVKKSFDAGKAFKSDDPYMFKALSGRGLSVGDQGLVEMEHLSQLFNCMEDLLVLEGAAAEFARQLEPGDRSLQVLLAREDACVQRLWHLTLPQIPECDDVGTNVLAACALPHMSLACCIAISAVFLIDMALDTFGICKSQRRWLIAALRDHIPRAEEHISAKFRMWLLYIAQERPQISKDVASWFRFVFLTETRAMGLNTS
ncbi:hypothetical protein H2200_005202 [Cladophialophora chaetospira]|uniref:Uncharacterized protein n=1 Tax=Cladophialophora chaetospira TaxID=386627 RepID=A0AA39CJE4_9EURO|nr:hypothetical protein H2200_005202 [Cladophialophora chaetospira]